MSEQEFKKKETQCLLALQDNYLLKHRCEPLVLFKEKYSALDAWTRSGGTVVSIEHKYRPHPVGTWNTVMLEKIKVEAFKHFIAASGGSALYISDYEDDVTLIWDVTKLIQKPLEYLNVLCDKNQYAGEKAYKEVIFIPYYDADIKLIDHRPVDSIQHLMIDQEIDFNFLAECGII